MWRAQAATGSTGLDEAFETPVLEMGALGTERDCSSVELQVRDPRLTDIDRITGLMDRSNSRWSLDQLTDVADVPGQVIVGFTESGPRMRLPLVRPAVALW